MIGSTALFLFSSIETGLLRLNGPYQHRGNVSKQILSHMMVARCQRVAGKHLSVWNNRISRDENRKSGFYLDEPSI